MNPSLATRPSGSASIGPRYEPDGGRTASRFAGTALNSLSDLRHDVSLFALIKGRVDFRNDG